MDVIMGSAGLAPFLLDDEPVRACLIFGIRLMVKNKDC